MLHLQLQLQGRARDNTSLRSLDVYLFHSSIIIRKHECGIRWADVSSTLLIGCPWVIWYFWLLIAKSTFDINSEWFDGRTTIDEQRMAETMWADDWSCFGMQSWSQTVHHICSICWYVSIHFGPGSRSRFSYVSISESPTNVLVSWSLIRKWNCGETTVVNGEVSIQWKIVFYDDA